MLRSLDLGFRPAAGLGPGYQARAAPAGVRRGPRGARGRGPSLSSPVQRRATLRALLERGVASGDIAATADLDMLAGLTYGVL
jgi:hypothetical protein